MALVHWFHELRNKRGLSWWKIPRSVRIKVRYSTDLRFDYPSTVWHGDSFWNPANKHISIGFSFLSSKFKFPALYFTLVENVRFIGLHATPVLATGEIVLTSKRDTPALFLEEISMFVTESHKGPTGAESYQSMVLSLASRLDMVYYHWVTEQLPQVFALLEASKRTNKMPVVYLRKDRPRFQDSSLTFLFPNVKIVDYKSDTNNPCVLLSTVPTKGFAAHPAVLRLRDHTFSILDDTKADSPQFIYIKRKIGGWRYIINEEEVLESVTKIGFTILDAAEYSFVEQVQLFRSARCVVSIFGSGLTNILFCKRATIIELAGDYADPCFASISGHVGNTHIRLNCTSMGDNIIVNTDELHALLISLNILSSHS
jgi:hypothetical protein